MLDIVDRERVRGRLRGALHHALQEGLLIRPGEGRRTALLFTHLVLASSVFVMGRTVRDTLFLSRYSLDALPWMFVLYGVASALTVVIYARVADRLRGDKMIVAWSALGIATYLGSWVCVRANLPWIYPAFYVWAEVFANLLLSQFWTLANELHDARTAKRLFGTIGAGRVMGVIVVGFATSAIVAAIGTAQLLFVLSLLLVVIAWLALLLGREPRSAKPAAKGRSRPAKKAPAVLRDPYVRSLAAMLLLTFSALTVGDYQFKAIARATYREDDLAQFFSLFYAGTGVISLLFQLVVTPRLLRRFGVGLGMSVMPAVFGVASFALLGMPTLGVATVMKFADNGLQYTIHDTTLQALYVPFPGSAKVRTRAFLDAVVKPVSYGFGGALLILFAGYLGTFALSWVVAPLVVLWLALIPLVRRRYIEKLSSTLRAGGLSTLTRDQVMDAAGVQILVQALASPEPRVVIAALDELGESQDPAIDEALIRLADHDDPDIRLSAITRLGGRAAHTGSTEDDDAILRALGDPVAEVRKAAATAHATARGDECVPALCDLLEDPDHHVRAATLAGLLSHGGLEGAMIAGRVLGELMASSDAEERLIAARALGLIGPLAAKHLLVLLRDPELSVRLAALDAAREVADARLVPDLLAALEDPRSRTAAAAALTAVGAKAAPGLAAILHDHEKPRPLRLIMPRVLRGIRSEESYAALLAAASDEDSHLRLRVFSALSKLRVTLGRKRESIEQIRSWVEREIAITYALLGGYENARSLADSPLLAEAIAFSALRGGRRILRILSCRYEPEALRLVRIRLEDPSHRANALEVLDTMLEPALRAVVLPFFDDLPVAQKAAQAGLPKAQDAEPFLLGRLRNPNPYSVAVALDAAVHAKLPFAAAEAQRLTSHPDPLVVDTAKRALSRIAGKEETVYSTIEKLLMLRSAPLFEKLRGEDLAPLARVAEVEEYQAGDPVFEHGQLGDALYVIVRGKVAIQKHGRTLANLGRGEAFGEMSVLDAEPRSADAVAIEETELLRIGSEEFYEVLREQVEIAEGVIRMLSRRLREANHRLEHETT